MNNKETGYMAHATLVMICATVDEALRANASIPRQYDMGLFYLFTGTKPPEETLDWIGADDDYLTIENLEQWGSDVESIIIRAGLMYARGWDLLFCHADRAPSIDALRAVRRELANGKGLIRREGIWGVTREHVVLHGVPALSAVPHKPQSTPQANLAREMEIAAAMQGRPATEEAVAAAVVEVVPNASAFIDPCYNRPPENEEATLARKIFAALNHLPRPHGLSIKPFALSDDELEQSISMLPRTRCLATISRDPKISSALYVPYRTFETTNGLFVRLYRSEGAQ